MEQRWTEIRSIHQTNQFGYRISGALVLILMGIGVGYILFNKDGENGYFTNLYTEGISIAITILVLNSLAERRENRREVEQKKRELILRLNSKVPDVAKRAIEELSNYGWLTDGTLKRLVLEDGANWEGVTTRMVLSKNGTEGIDMEGSQLPGINLKKSALLGANLCSCYLSAANLEGSHLDRARLQNANLYLANLSGTSVFQADFRGTDLHEANLAFIERIERAYFDEHTTLPDGSKWSQATDMQRFTRPDHPNFYYSIAYNVYFNGASRFG